MGSGSSCSRVNSIEEKKSHESEMSTSTIKESMVSALKSIGNAKRKNNYSAFAEYSQSAAA